ncbi:bifunctional metallophosphatase/5'-nucleotidase [Pseudogracilibacillus sp. SO10305]|uniref:bifunctional metallophosphatase/5'-nucleotidase n=1 Tax=Pseudogracilibacillus sp. SO10305 TaxID=3098292 RepID=UPI00300DC422
MRKILIGVALVFFVIFGKTDVFAAEENKVTILFTHDLHDNLYPFEVEREGVKQLVGGMARMFTAVENERKENPDAFLVDAGDYSMGTLFQTIFTTHTPMMQIMGQMDYDAITYGNHEFDFRAEGLAEALKSAVARDIPLPKIVASNVHFPKDDDGKMADDIAFLKEAMDEYGVLPYDIIEKKGVKIGVIGLLGEDAASNAPMSGVTFDDNVETAKKTVKILQKENVDMIIASSHSGTSETKKVSEDEVLAEKVPEIDVIISGHTHTTLEEPIISGDTVIGSAGEYGENLGKMELVQKEDGRWDLTKYDLIHIDETIEPNEKIAKMIDGFKEVVQEDYLSMFDLDYDEVIANSPFDFTEFSSVGKKLEETTIGNLIGDAYIDTIKQIEGEDYEEITAAVIPSGVIRNSFYKGAITTSDVFNVSSLGIGADGTSGYPVIDVYITGKELRTVAEVDASVAPIMPSAQLYVSGLTYTFNPNRILFNKVTDVAIQNPDGTLEEIEDDKLYRIVAGLYSAQMLPVVGEKSFNLLSVEPKTKDGEVITDYEAQILHLEDGSEVKEWYAIAAYLQSFAPVDGIPQVPADYAQLKDRKIMDDDKSLSSILSKPNGIVLGLYGIVAGVVLVLVFGIRWLVKRRKKKKIHQNVA